MHLATPKRDGVAVVLRLGGAVVLRLGVAVVLRLGVARALQRFSDPCELRADALSLSFSLCCSLIKDKQDHQSEILARCGFACEAVLSESQLLELQRDIIRHRQHLGGVLVSPAAVKDLQASAMRGAAGPSQAAAAAANDSASDRRSYPRERENYASSAAAAATGGALTAAQKARVVIWNTQVPCD